MTGPCYVYILASRYRGTMYVGVTNDLARRISEHKAGVIPGFTRSYRTDRLVYCEDYTSITDARARAHAQALAPRVEVRVGRNVES